MGRIEQLQQAGGDAGLTRARCAVEQDDPTRPVRVHATHHDHAAGDRHCPCHRGEVGRRLYSRAVATFFQLTIDCRRPARLVAFWQPLLGYKVPAPPERHQSWRAWYLTVGVSPEEIEGDGSDRLQPVEGHGVAIWFQPVPEPKTIKNRLHLDLRVSTGRAVDRQQRRAEIQIAADDVVARGGALLRMIEDSTADHVYAVMADPEGNEFCFV